ncbi:tRNA (adenine-N1)-methyltransferase [Bellilinea sp.]|uniref:tRNA (adenine-N1)-methyltransferase n=1 Tax=Bellilinea sp. TaxID=2838785 RepID=UPI002ADE1B98|nr:tRNA (adenine-N1)-methyltransferase [Bellilinea sp.]
MSWNLHGTTVNDGDLAQLVGLRHKSFIVRVKQGGELQTHRGVVKFDDIIGKPWGSRIRSHMGNPFYVLQPALGDLLKELPRNTQILYPKDIGFILVQMGIGEGQVVLEAGTGSGSLTSAMAFAVGSRGKVITYEAREEMQKLARKNISRLGLEERVDFKLRELTQEQGFDEEGVDALFLDLPNPYDYIHHARKALKMGGFFGCILPTANQVSKLLLALRQFDFAFVDVCEVLLRYYKPEPDRLRPVDRMVAHTGFLIFARPVLIENGDEQINELEETDELENDSED